MKNLFVYNQHIGVEINGLGCLNSEPCVIEKLNVDNLNNILG